MSDPVKASLDGAFSRTVRAEEHLVDLIRRIEAFRKEQENTITWEWDSNPEVLGEPKPLFHKLQRIPPVFGVVIGEICYNLRSALDYLVFELAILDSGQIVDGTQFPIEDKKKGFEWWRKKGRLNGLSAAHVASIETFQPYNGCRWSSMLRDISNPDKHRHLVLHQGMYDVSVYANADRLRFLNIPGRVTSAKHPVSGKEVYVQINMAFKILFGDGTPVIQALKEVQAAVAQTLADFKPEFQ